MNEFIGRFIWLAGRFTGRLLVVLLLLLVLLFELFRCDISDDAVDEFVLHDSDEVVMVVEQVALVELDNDEGEVERRVVVVIELALVSFDE